MINPFLIGERIYLRLLDEKDVEGNYVAWLNDPVVCAHNSHGVFPYHALMAHEYIKKTIGSKDALVLAIALKENDIHIGNIALQEIDFINRNAEYAIILGEKDYWGKGYSKEASILLIKHGFLQLNLHRMYCGTSAENIAMQKLALSLGMEQEGVRKDALYKMGKYINVIEYGISKHDFLKKFAQKDSNE